MLKLNWNFDKPFYSPSQMATISVWAENTGIHDIYVSEVAVEFDFNPGIYNLSPNVGGLVSSTNVGSPGMTFLGKGALKLPQNIVGSRIFNLRYKIYELRNGQWCGLPLSRSGKYILNIFATPVYKLFLSRGTHSEDRLVGDPIAQMIREWGFEPVTVGIDIDVPDSQVNSRIDYEIQNSCGLVAIATRRVLDYRTQTYRTLEWLHSETGLAYAMRKPILILKDKNVRLGGLASFLHPQTILEFDPMDLYDLKNKLSILMPRFRNSITTNNTREYYQNLEDLITKGLAFFGGAVIVSGIIGMFFDNDKD